MFSICKYLSHILFIALITKIQLSDGLRIVGIFPIPARSVYSMCEVLMKGLAEKGHEVDVYSHFPPTNSIPNYKHISLLGSMPILKNNFTYQELSSMHSRSEELKQWFRNIGHTMCELMGLDLFQKLIHQPPKDPPYDLVITDMHISPCYYAWGRHLNVPVIGVSTTPAMNDYEFELSGNPLNLAVDVCNQCSHAPPLTFFQRLHNFISFHFVKHLGRQCMLEQDVYVNKYFGPGYPDALTLTKEISLIFVNHNHALFGIRPFIPKVVPVGGLHVIDNNETLPMVVKEWLDNSDDGCIYFTFGSMMRIETFPKHILEVFYKAFRNIAPVRILMKIPKPEELPPDLPQNVFTYHWLPQIQVLQHKNIRAFMTHGGLMGTQESVYYGIPMVGFPLFYDQFMNIENYVKMRIAIEVNVFTMTEKTLTHALNEIIKNPIYKNEVQRVSNKFKDQPTNPIDTAVYWVEYISRHGKNALQYSIVNMPWWQSSLLDIYAFIGIVIFTILFIVSRILKVCVNLFRSKKRSHSHEKVKKN